MPGSVGFQHSPGACMVCIGGGIMGSRQASPVWASELRQVEEAASVDPSLMRSQDCLGWQWSGWNWFLMPLPVIMGCLLASFSCDVGGSWPCCVETGTLVAVPLLFLLLRIGLVHVGLVVARLPGPLTDGTQLGWVLLDLHTSSYIAVSTFTKRWSFEWWFWMTAMILNLDAVARTLRCPRLDDKKTTGRSTK